MNLNKKCRPENYRVMLSWNKGSFDSDPETVLSVWEAFRAVNYAKAVNGQNRRYTNIQAEMFEGGGGPVTFKQLQILAKIVSIQSQREDNFLDNKSMDAAAAEILLAGKQKKLMASL